VGSALFGFGLGGLILFRWPMPTVPTARLFAATAWAFALSVVLIVPVMMLLPINLAALSDQPFRQLLALGVLYVSLVVPFVASGVAIAGALARHVHHVHRLYFCDLLGAGVGCLGIFVLPQLIGGEATLFAVAVLGLAGAAMFAPPSSRFRVLSGMGAAVATLLAVGLADRLTFPHLVIKRGVTTATVSEFSYWDPVSKIDVTTMDSPNVKRIIYDGGAQSSTFHRFDGNLAALRETYFTPPEQGRYNSGRYIALSHWLQRDQGGRVLVIGSAGGQETLAALTWGAGHVDAVDMVCTVIKAAQGRFAEFIGGIYSHPRVSAVCDEGRSFLRRSERKYDVIQIHSNHTTSSLANGAGAAAPIYLQTVEAYKDYLTHLTPNGILQINYFIYPKMVTTAVQAWSELFPGEDFRAHLLITDGFQDAMKTFMVKRSPWTAREIAEVRSFLSPGFGIDGQYKLIYAPGEPEARNVPEALFRVPLDPKVVASLPYRIEPATDDEPFFRHLRKGVQRLKVDEAGFIPEETANHINAPLRGIIPLDFVHVYVIGGLSVMIAAGLLLVPLLGLRQAALTRTEGLATLVYFGCLGVGFVVVELVLIYKFMLVIGPPIYAMAAVIFAMLVGAGIGSALSTRVYARCGPWAIATAVGAFAVLTVCLLLAFPALDRLALALPLGARMAVVLLIVFLIGVPLGMPFPLGLTALSLRSPGLIPWGWAINAFMTVAGSLLAVVLSMAIGFTATLMLAIGIYAIAGACYFVLVPSLTRAPGPVPAVITSPEPAAHALRVRV
jgi:spermidine synthase